MRHPFRKFVLALFGLAVAASLWRAALSGALGPDEGVAATASGIAGLAIGLAALYFAVAGALAAWGAGRLAAGVGVIARWRVPAATWQAFRAIGVEQTGVRVPMLSGLLFAPRALAPGETIEIVCGRKGVLIDGCYFALAPGRGAGMEEAGLVLTEPPCLAFVIATPIGGPRAPRISRRLLLLPIPPDARDAANQAVRHYDAAIARVRDIGDLARAYPVAARALFWTILLVSVAAAAAGFALEAYGFPGTLPAALGITGFMVALGCLLIALSVRFSRR